MSSPARRAAPIAVALFLVALAGAGGAVSSSGAPKTALRVVYWQHGQDQAAEKIWALSCQPAGGSHPKPKLACAELAAHPGALAPVTKPCTLLLPRGTPAALVSGRYRGRSVNRLFRPGCDRLWTPLHALLTGT